VQLQSVLRCLTCRRVFSPLNPALNRRVGPQTAVSRSVRRLKQCRPHSRHPGSVCIILTQRGESNLRMMAGGNLDRLLPKMYVSSLRFVLNEWDFAHYPEPCSVILPKPFYDKPTDTVGELFHCSQSLTWFRSKFKLSLGDVQWL
jgi:hypothetical protein